MIALVNYAIRLLLKMLSCTSKLFYTACILFIGYKVTLAERQALELTKVMCEILDKDFAELKKWNLTKTPEGRMMFSGQLHLLQKLETTKVKIKVLRKVGKDYRPFFVEATINVCSFLQDYKRQIPWGLIFAETVKFSNVNHSCPYNHDLIMENFTMNSVGFKSLPLPKGDYLLEMLLLVDKVKKIKTQSYVTKYF